MTILAIDQGTTSSRALIFSDDLSVLASALSVVNFLVCLVIIAIYLVTVKPTKER